MTYDFAALRFTEDENLAERVYWYLCGFPVAEGERVLAPVGAHSRLQAARVERTLTADEKNAPYDLRLIKEVAAKCGARKLIAGGAEFLEFGGVRYDEKRYTPYGKLLLAKTSPQMSDELLSYGVTLLWEGGADEPATYEKLSRERGCAVVIGKAGEKIFETLLKLVRGENMPLYEMGVKRDTVALLEEKLR